MKRILYVLGYWGSGGIEKVIVAYCSSLSKKYQIDVFAFNRGESIFDVELEKLGIKVITPPKKIQGNHYVKNMRRLKEFLQVASQGYDLIHYHTSFALAYWHCHELKKNNPKTKILLHSHGDNVNPPYKYAKILTNKLIKEAYQKVPDYALACSSRAGNWLYPSVVLNERYEPLMNPIRLEQYKYDEKKRIIQRKKWGLKEEYVIGTIGRIEYQKYPDFIVEIICEMEKKGIEYRFVWIGTGADEKRVKTDIYRMKLDSRVIFVKHTNDVPSTLSALDVFILPSRYEGLGLVLLEAQASGLDVIAATTIPTEAGISETISWIPTDNPQRWADEIINRACDIGNKKRVYPAEGIKNNGFEYDLILTRLDDIYTKLLS